MKLLILVLALAAPLLAGDEWPNFRGPLHQGVAADSNPPVEWSEEKNVAWKTELPGKAWSSPVVANGKVWLTNATEDGRQLSVVCLDAGTGETLIDKKLFDVLNPQYCIPFNSYASPTPVVEGERVYLSWGSPAIACISTENAEILWERRDIECNHFRGPGASPLLWEDLLIMSFDGSDFQFITALDKNTGKTVWRTERSVDYQDLQNGKPEADGDWRKGFSTPVIAMSGSVPTLVSLGSKCAYGYNPRTGEEYWRLEDRASHSGSATPVPGDNGTVYLCSGLGNNKLRAVKLGGAGVLGESDVRWVVDRAVSGRSSPLLKDGLIFMVDDGGIASCLDADSGEEYWRERVGGNYSAAPVWANGNVYFCSEQGVVTVVPAQKTFKVLSENEFDDGFMASPAVVGDALILRTRSAVYRVESR